MIPSLIGISLIAVIVVATLSFIPQSNLASRILPSLACIVPYLLFLGFVIIWMNPNRKLMRVLRQEGRNLAPPEKPQVIFGPVQPK